MNFLRHERTENWPCRAEFSQHHAEGDQRERPQAMHRSQEIKNRPAQAARVRERQNAARSGASGRRTQSADLAFGHAESVTMAHARSIRDSGW